MLHYDCGEADLPGERTGRVEWAVAWLEEGEGFLHSYCNTVPTAQGGTHETGFRNALLKGLRAWGEQRGNRRAAQVTAEDVLGRLAAKLSLFLREPQFQGQTKEKLTSPEADAAGGNGGPRPLRPLPRRRPHLGGQSAGVRDRAGGGAATSARAEGHGPQIRHAAAAPARQAGRLHA